MLDEEKLLARAKAIHRELRLRRPTILQAWMAQYVAECIDRLASGTGGSRVKHRCADTIARLWNTQVQLQKNDVERGVNHYIKRTGLDAKAIQALRVALDAPERARTGVTSESAVTVWQLSEVERLVIQVLWGAERRKRSAAPVSEQEKGERDWMGEMHDRLSSEAQQQLAGILPTFAAVPLDDYDKVLGLVTETLRAIDRLRRRLIWADHSSMSHEPQPEGGSERSATESDSETL